MGGGHTSHGPGLRVLNNAVKQIMKVKKMSNNRSKEKGFTLIELMVVIVILGILAGFVVPRIMGRPEEARRMKARVQIESIETALNLYKLDNGSYPTTEQGLQALVEAPNPGPAAAIVNSFSLIIFLGSLLCFKLFPNFFPKVQFEIAKFIEIIITIIGLTLMGI